MIIKTWLSEVTKSFTEKGITSARLDALIILEEVLGQERSWVLAHDETELADYLLKQLNDLAAKRRQRIPLSYIVGVREFYGLDFYVDDNVLVPRPETEVLVEYAVKNLPDKSRVLEIGTGSGAIAVSLKYHRRDIEVRATDISSLALIIAKRNAATNHVDINFQKSDLFENISGSFDAVLANLPYVPVGARRQPEIKHEPDIALFGGKDGLDFYRVLLSELDKYLEPQGIGLLEFSPTQYRVVQALASKHKLKISPISEYIYLCQPKS